MITWRSITRTFQRSHVPLKAQVRQLSLLEHHSYNLLKEFKLPVPLGFLVTTPEQAKDVVSEINGPSMIKAQVLAGGRGKGKFNSDGKSGVRMVNSPNEAFKSATNMIGHNLTTAQTPADGLRVNKLYIYKAVFIAREFYLAMTFDRQHTSPVLLISSSGGINIESNVDKLHKLRFGISTGITDEIDAYVQAELGFSDAEMKDIHRILVQMVKLFKEKDATLVELNPLVRTDEGEFVCLDAKLGFDNAARYRQKEIFALEERPPDEEEELQLEKLGLSYVRLDGNIGNIVNGAGLAMATNDLISLYGGKCANFLDVGGGATKEALSKGFEILKNDQRVKGILINIYGGIVRCDMIAEAIVAAATEMGGFKCPVVVRLQGTNSEKGLRLVEQSRLENLVVEAEFEKAAQMVVKQTPPVEV
ncbi:ATP-grasp fold succinyl-CoA synthetase-type [Penicillium cf. griseofulvum]|uniref:Succinate-CoA ligase subunit beta n=1 Tax=Penicillium cf. griseofulvum TaxID=2972120 RepID=A0A9W9MZ03_9EURO|nr:ATP-grasp fold succinyl-CoA synthetase-type [Penicillium cf. griseofulvum]KAJ5421537.1 ATP-grasp fold succinyl-CoA synthetase-type [Penicillium cf. griseofulvum]KAJ5424772.1 ATP-grasp fold succinyl-CoA synthetase-type [Penicillium cf. griseofulvum]